MRLAYLDCFAGISGDMFLGALIDAGVPVAVLQDAVAALDVNASLRHETVDRSGIACTKVHVLEGEHLAEDIARPHQHPHPPQSHPHSRSLTTIRALLQAANLAGPVKAFALRTFELLGASEARIHKATLDEIHFHEVGAVDAIADIVAASAGIHHLNLDAWYSSPLNVGGGMVVCAHGTFPVPAPATADLLRGMPTYSAHLQKELVTPTGAALIRALNPAFGPQPPMRVEHIGYGAGTRNPQDLPNVLRVSVGVSDDATDDAAGDAANDAKPERDTETVTVLETAIDDLSPQLLAYVAEAALAQGALDVMLAPVIMKKGRPGTLLTILCDAAHGAALQELLLRETTTLGVRIRQDRRRRLDRTHITVKTAYGPIRIKLGSVAGEIWNAAPEFEDCRTAAEQHNVALKRVQQAAIAAYSCL